MTARFALFRWTRELAELPGFPKNHPPHWNLAPGAQLLMLREEAGVRRADLARWGLTPAWLTDLSRTPAHARAETLHEQPMFREAFARRRCLVPANGFYEWRGVRKRPYWVAASGGLSYFAGIWEAYPVDGHTWLSLALVTRAAGDLRRPLLLQEEDDRGLWLDAGAPQPKLLSLLARPQPGLREQALATIVNDPACDGPECLTPA
ncbi:SOS response-associated peptidase [Pseudomonas citronellolis]|uniref:SOS response-associated peptidase n=1 Tax=Pseudomonas citronellolis TaxID=53408 RepID=UPI0023E35805|nr:SOS response-associated peptidase [Pseudomonas citronellolis]MDF3931611.1 SOS response-associated peptidase [Pseudomonas citronellolis]